MQEEEKKHLLSDDTFNKLIEAQKRISHETDVAPTLRRLVNMIIDDAAIEICINDCVALYK